MLKPAQLYEEQLKKENITHGTGRRIYSGTAAQGTVISIFQITITIPIVLCQWTKMTMLSDT